MERELEGRIVCSLGLFQRCLCIVHTPCLQDGCVCESPVVVLSFVSSTRRLVLLLKWEIVYVVEKSLHCLAL